MRIEGIIQLARKLPREIFYRSEPPTQFVHGRGKHTSSSMRLKSNSQHLRWTSGPQQQGTINLAGKETTRLPPPPAVFERFERLAPVENQFRMAVRDYALHTLFAIVFENPKGMYERPEPGRRPDFTIPNHIRMIAAQMPNWRR